MIIIDTNQVVKIKQMHMTFLNDCDHDLLFYHTHTWLFDPNLLSHS